MSDDAYREALWDIINIYERAAHSSWDADYATMNAMLGRAREAVGYFNDPAVKARLARDREVIKRYINERSNQT